MSFSPSKAGGVSKSASSIEGLAFRTIGAALSTTPAMTLKDSESGSYVSMFGFLSDRAAALAASASSPAASSPLSSSPSTCPSSFEESPYENVLSAPPGGGGGGGGGGGRGPVYENLSDFMRYSEMELRYASYDTLPSTRASLRASGSLTLGGNGRREAAMYKSTPCLSSLTQEDEPIYDVTPSVTTTTSAAAAPAASPLRSWSSGAALYDSIPCNIDPPPRKLEDFHFRPLPNIKDKQGPLRKLFSLPKHFHRKKNATAKLRSGGLRRLEELPSTAVVATSRPQSGGDLDVSVDVTIRHNRTTIRRHASEELLYVSSGQQRAAPVVLRPPAEMPPKPPRLAAKYRQEDAGRKEPTADRKQPLANQQSFQQELRIVLEKRASARLSGADLAEAPPPPHTLDSDHDDDEGHVMRQRAASCSQLEERSSGAYDRPWDDYSMSSLAPPDGGKKSISMSDLTSALTSVRRLLRAKSAPEGVSTQEEDSSQPGASHLDGGAQFEELISQDKGSVTEESGMLEGTQDRASALKESTFHDMSPKLEGESHSKQKYAGSGEDFSPALPAKSAQKQTQPGSLVAPSTSTFQPQSVYASPAAAPPDEILPNTKQPSQQRADDSRFQPSVYSVPAFSGTSITVEGHRETASHREEGTSRARGGSYLNRLVRDKPPPPVRTTSLRGRCGDQEGRHEMTYDVPRNSLVQAATDSFYSVPIKLSDQLPSSSTVTTSTTVNPYTTSALPESTIYDSVAVSASGPSLPAIVVTPSVADPEILATPVDDRTNHAEGSQPTERSVGFTEGVEIFVEFIRLCEELLPGIEDYLTRVLAGETLSEAAEKRRQYYSERLDVLKLAFPPTLPPRNEDDIFIAQQRELARTRGTLPPPEEGAALESFDDGEEYDLVEEPVVSPPGGGLLQQDDLYEEPIDLTDNTTSAPLDENLSDTSYESYDDDDDGTGTYVNQEFHDPTHDPPLPRTSIPLESTDENSSRNRKKKKESGGIPARALPNVSVCGELYMKVKWSWSKRYCILTEGRLLAFKSDNATKPAADVTLDGYDVIYLEKEAKRNHVIRISRPGCETLFYSAETKEKADQWLEVLSSASCGGSGGSITTSGFSSAASSSPKVDKDTEAPAGGATDGVRKSSSLTDLSVTSEGSSGDGTIGQTSPADKKSIKTDRKGSKPLFDSLSTFFGTLGKKKGEKVQQQKPRLAEMEEDADPDAVVSGYMVVYSDLLPTRKWNRRWCVIKEGILSVFREMGDDAAELSIPLAGCDVLPAGDAKHKMAVKISEEGKDKITLDMPDTIAQGQWLNVLIHETGCGQSKPPSASPATTNGGPDDAGLEEEDIYCDVDDDQELLRSWNLTKGLSSGISNKTEEEETPEPPPLPSAPPPGVSVTKVGSQVRDSVDGWDGMESDELYENIDTVRDQMGISGQLPEAAASRNSAGSGEQEGGELYENTGPVDITSEYLHPPNERENVEEIYYDEVTCDQQERLASYQQQPQQKKDQQQKQQQQQQQRQQQQQQQPQLKQPQKKEQQGKQPVAKPQLQKKESQSRQAAYPEWDADDDDTDDDNDESDEGDDVSTTTDNTASEADAEGLRTPTNYVLKKIRELESASSPEYLKTDKSKVNRAQRRTSIKRPTEAPPSVPTLKRGDKKSEGDEASKEVVKCHLGPTIDEDLDILKSAKNPILNELRRSRTGVPTSKPSSPPPSVSPATSSSSLPSWKETDSARVDESISQTKKKLANIKKKRATIRSQKLSCTDIEEKLALDDKLRDLLREQDNAEAELAKLSLRQAELQAQERKSRLEQESIARRESLSRIERQGSFSRLERKDSLTGLEQGEWDIISRKAGGSEEAAERKPGSSSPRSNGSSSPSHTRKANSLDRSVPSTAFQRSTTSGSRNGLGGPGTRGSGRTTRYTSDLTGRTTTRTASSSAAVSRTSSMSRGTAPGSPKGLRITRSEEENDRSPSPRGGRKQVQEKLKLWENMSGSSNC